MNDRVAEVALPISPRVIMTLDEGYRICAPMEYTMSGVNMKRPDGWHYYDVI